MMVCYSAVLLGIAGGLSGGNDERAALLLAIGLGGVPVVFVVLAFASRNLRASTAVLKAMGLFLAAGVPVALLSLPAGLVAGFGAGGVVALRREDTDKLRARIWAVALSSAYIMVVTALVFQVGALSGSVFPFVAIGAADSITKRRALQTPG